MGLEIWEEHQEILENKNIYIYSIYFNIKRSNQFIHCYHFVTNMIYQAPKALHAYK